MARTGCHFPSLTPRRTFNGLLSPDAVTWTEDNLLRQVSYQAQRKDKPAKQVVRPVPHLASVQFDGLLCPICQPLGQAQTRLITTSILPRVALEYAHV